MAISLTTNDLYIGATSERNTKDLLTRESEYEGIRGYLFFRKNLEKGYASLYNADVIRHVLNKMHLLLEDAWEIASFNTCKEVRILPITEALSGSTMGDEENLYIITNIEHFKGASAAFFRTVLKKFADEHNTREIAVLPSSIDEMLLVPHPEKVGDRDSLSDLVKSVNKADLTPEEFLSDQAYFVKF